MADKNFDFDSEFASVIYHKEDNVVLLTWKQEAHLENYRNPTLAALALLNDYPNSNFVVDARNGFEDDKRDVEWGFEYLLPQMSETSCQFVSFIMCQENSIEAEMDMWTLEFGKYFAVTRADSYEKALSTMREAIYVNVKYVLKDGTRKEFLEQLAADNIIQNSKSEPGNISYEVSLPLDSENTICLNEMWTNEAAQKRHGNTAHYQVLSQLKQRYVEEVYISCYDTKKK